jgi:2-polyprenylphenol 6-hydroxylase
VKRQRSTDFDVIVVGAGATGLVVASLLVARKLAAPDRVAIVADRFTPPLAPGTDWDLRVFAISRASQRLLRICGIWDGLPSARVFPYERMRVWDADGTPNGSGSLTFDCAQIGEPNLGYIVDGRELQWHCLQAARALGVTLIEGAVTGVDANDEDVTLRLSDGRALRSSLLAAADGADSKVRETVGIDTAGHAYQQDALVAHVRTSRPHANTAWQRFLSTGPVAFLPLGDGRSSIVWSITRSRADELRAMSVEQFGSALTEASGEALGQCTLTTPLASFPLKLQYAVDYARPRVALLGDAAHVVHPLAGQGLNLGFLDCAALAQVLEEAGGAQRFGDYKTLRHYERWRRSENLLAAAALDGLERLFAGSGGFNTGLRIAGLNAIAHLPLLKRHFAQRALGLEGDVAQFLKAV